MIVADSVPDVHLRAHGTLRTELGIAAKLLGLLPNELREMTPALEVRHVRVRLSIVGGRPKGKLPVIPHVSCGLSTGFDSADILNGLLVGRAPHGNVLTITTTAGSPYGLSVQLKSKAWSGNILQVMLEYA